MKAILQKLIHQENLSCDESYALFTKLTIFPVAQQASVLALLRAKKETSAEILGARSFFMEQAKTLQTSIDVLDIVGTGGDNKNTFNITTAASFVIAASGVYVAKHGGRSATSQSGSNDIVDHLTLPIYQNAALIVKSLQMHSYVYLSASLLNSTFASFSNLRKTLPFPTIFNILGPLLNPMRPNKMVIGVYRSDLVNTVAECLVKMRVNRALVIHSEDGLDEISICAPTQIAEINNGCIRHYRLDPKLFGIPSYSLSSLEGTTPQENARVILEIFNNTVQGAKLDVILLNSAAGLYIAGKVDSFKEGIALARTLITSGKVLALVERIKRERFA